MGKNYYSILGVGRTASDVDLKQAFRRQALIWHPQRNEDDVANARVKFDEICEGYNILINPVSRAAYDLYGEEVLKRGQPDGQGGFHDAWVSIQSSEETFARFFGSNSPFMVDGRIVGEALPFKVPDQIEPIITIIYATLEEVFSGVTRSVTITRQVHLHNRIVDEQVSLSVPIAKGTVAGTRVVFAGAGHRIDDQVGDVDIEIRMASHPMYRRKDYDLIVEKELFMTDALTGGVVRVATLDGRILSLPIGKMLLPGERERIEGEGLQRPDGRRGDLVVEFAVRYPTELSFGQKRQLRRLLPPPIPT